MEVEHDALLGREQLERLVDPFLFLAALEGAIGGLGALGQARVGRGRVEVGDADRRRAPLARADLAERDVDADPVQPGRQPRVAAKPIEPAERDDEDLLDEVIEIAAVAQDAVQVAGDLAAKPMVQLVVRGAILGLAARDQIRFVGRSERRQRAGLTLHSCKHNVRSHK